MNIYLYIPAASADQLGVDKAMVYGSLRRYYLQNTHGEDYLKQLKLLFVRMKTHAIELPKLTSMVAELENNKTEERLLFK